MIPLRDSQPSRHTPFVTILLIVTNAFIFFYEISLDSYSLNHLIAHYGIVPARFQPADLLTSMFLHGGWMHLIGNMWFLWIYGDNIEDILGGFQYLVFYLLCGVAAGLLQFSLDMDSRIPTIGASGAIAGVMGAYLVKFPRAYIVTLLPIIVFWTLVEIPAWLILIYWFVLQIFSGASSIAYSNVSQGGVAWFAHIGGFVAGIVLIFLLRTQEPYRHRTDLRW
ncbi:MAG TPA: rhomboid family intramembrane serine protease [Solibacterales bacterium]|nr:rhomboid family intramembrane serine protease [Bryobacterales bacterium]